jgi:hypothetical protein
MESSTTESNFGKQQMASSTYKALQSQTVSKSAGRRDALAAENELSMFNLRDTLSSIIVRDANFGEFLSALKQCGLHTARS